MRIAQLAVLRGPQIKHYRRRVAVVVLVVVVLSGAVGLLVQRLLRRRPDDGNAAAEGLDAGEMIGPVRVVVALILAFVLVQTFSSFNKAGDAAGTEAAAVSAEANAAALLAAPASNDIVGALRCYARAVAGPGWSALERTRHTSPVVDRASERVEAALKVARADNADPSVMTEVLTADHDRVAAREVRLAEAEPSVPGVVTALLIACVAITVAGTAALADRRMRAGLRMTLVAVTAIIFTGAMLVILDLDRPFGGLAAIQPTAMRSVEQQIGADPLGANPPCDASGAP